jgi:ketosteroid isomerase-like protein
MSTVKPMTVAVKTSLVLGAVSVVIGLVLLDPYRKDISKSASARSHSENVELHICGFGPLDGTWRGRDEVVAATRRNFALVASQKPEVESMISQGDSVVVLLRESGAFKSSRQTYSVRAVQWFTFEGGKIRKIDEIVASIWKVES